MLSIKANRQLEPRPRPDLRILILNWRCPRNPRAGGAELVTHEIARRLVANGHIVEWFSASFPGAAAEETIDGVRIVRAGRQWSVHLQAFRRYWRRLAGRFDVVVDQVNTVPFFTPLWSEIPSLMLIHQLAREVWWFESVFPVNAIGYLLEPLYLRLYRDRPVITVSESTKADLQHLGFRKNIWVIPEGIEPVATSPRTRSTEPTFAYVGRLAPSKRVAHIIQAFGTFCRNTQPGQLLLVGEGSRSYVGALQRIAADLGLSDRVAFLGRVTADEKHHAMSMSHMLLLASAREGWGLVVTEAGALGTPTVAYDVAGLRDSIRNEDTGLLVPESPAFLAEAMHRLWTDPVLYQRLSAGATAWNSTFSWDKTATAFESAVKATLSGHDPSPPSS